MSKPLVFVKNRVRIEKIGKEVDSWDLISFGDCPIMHAAWNPHEKFLICQFSSSKENVIQIPKQSSNGKVTFKDSKADQYYRVTIYDKDAIAHILETYVSNWTEGDSWQLQDQFEEPEEVEVGAETSEEIVK